MTELKQMEQKEYRNLLLLPLKGTTFNCISLPVIIILVILSVCLVL